MMEMTFWLIGVIMRKFLMKQGKRLLCRITGDESVLAFG